jgi:hypothetical protein
VKKWHENVDEIATFLSGANPKLAESKPDGMLTGTELTTTEVVAVGRTGGGHEASTRTRAQLMFSDMLTDGIIKQFPNKFTK